MNESKPRNLLTLPQDLPRPIDDGAATHLEGMRVPSVPLRATNGEAVDLSAISGLVVVFAYPRTGRPGEAPIVPDWASTPRPRRCPPQPCPFRDFPAELH